MQPAESLYRKGCRSEREAVFGFKKTKSTVDAINTVMYIARKAIKGKRLKGGSKKYCAIITLDVKNAGRHDRNGDSNVNQRYDCELF